MIARLLRQQPGCFARSSLRFLSTGDSIDLQKQFTQQDVDAFTALTGDSNPIHKADQSSNVTTGAVVLPGMLLATLFPAIIGSRFAGALYLSQTLKFRRSAAVGTWVSATVTVAKRSGSRVTFDTVCRDPDGQVLVDGTALALISSQAAGGPQPQSDATQHSRGD